MKPTTPTSNPSTRMAMYDPEKHHRRSIRLKGHDYASPGAYFVTICTHGMQSLFGKVVDGEMQLNRSGRIVHDEWYRSEVVRTNVRMDEIGFIVMPNHLHGIILILNDDTTVGATRRVAPTKTPTTLQSQSIGAIIGQIKSIVTKRIDKTCHTSGRSVWQRNYYEHIIRNEHSLNRIRQYIQLNPTRWKFDHYNPDAIERTDDFAWVQNPDTTQTPMPHTYDALSVGDDFSWSRTLTRDDVRAFADITGDDNPLHVDADYAAGTRFGKPVVHGVYILGLASKVLGRDFPGHGSIAVSLQAKFLRPVPVGEEVTIQVKVAEKIEKHRHVKMRLFAYVGGKMAVGGEAIVIPPENGKGE